MTRINTTTNHGVYTREKVSPLGNEEQAKATSLHGSGGSPDSRLFGTGKDATGHSAKPSSEKSKAFVDEVRRLLGRGEAGAWLLYSQLQAGRLPFKPEEMSSKEILDVAAVLEYDPFGVEIFKLLVLGENPKIDLGRLSAEDSHVFADKLLEQGLGGMDLLEGLVREDRLPNILINKPKEFIDFCFSRGTSGLSLLQVFADKDKMSKFGPSEFSPEETKALADKLSDYDLLSRDSLAKLIKQGKLPSLAAGAEIAGTTGTQSVDGATTKSLTSEQSNYMSIIRKQLLAGGYNGDFVQAICSAMEKMYTESFTFEGETFESFNDFLDAKLPETIKSAGGVSYANVEKRKDNYGTFSEEVDGMVKYGEWGAYPTSDSKAVHQMVTDEDSIKLRKTLTVARAAYFENHGADFSLIQGWLLGQLFSSWSKGPTSVKILLIQNKKCRTDVQDCVYLDPYEEDYILSKMQVQPSDKFRKSLVLQKAFTAIALSKIEAPGVIDSENATIKLRRGLILSKNFRKRNGLQGVAAEDMVGREFTEAKNGIADSTALGTPSPTFCFTSTYGMYRNSPKVVVEYEMPICDVHAAFMFEEKLQAIGNEFMKWQHEVICDLVDKKAKIIYVDLIKNEHAQEL